jgi:hypothetical protein
MESVSQETKTVTRRKGQFYPGDPRIKPGPGRPPRTDQIKLLERLTKQQVNEALEKLVGPALQRLLRIVDRGQDPEAVRVALALLDRVAGAVPSASYVAANISGGGNEAKIVTADEIRATVLGYAARLAAREIDGADHRD